MKLVSWNVNGLRACMGKGFMDFFTAVEADVFCLQETKMQEGQVVFDFRVINSIGTVHKKKVIPELLF